MKTNENAIWVLHQLPAWMSHTRVQIKPSMTNAQTSQLNRGSNAKHASRYVAKTVVGTMYRARVAFHFKDLR
jgi:hypothetical protein